MLKVICFGEALIDFLSNRINNQGIESESFTKFPGGAPANAAVAIAKLGGNAYFAGMLGQDSFGLFLEKSLKKQNVKTDYVHFTQQAKTALAFVSLDEDGERSFEFYRPPSADLCFQKEHFDKSWFNQPGCFHFCSNSLTEQPIQEATLAGVKLARDNRWIVSFDVNLRPGLWHKKTPNNSAINEFLLLSDIIKMSKEELLFFTEEEKADGFIESLLDNGVSIVLVTDGGGATHWYTKNQRGSLLPPTTKVVDTTAAGDAFIGGFLYYLSQCNVSRPELDNWVKTPSNIEHALAFACACGAHAVSVYGAFPSLPTLASLKKLYPETANEFS